MASELNIPEPEETGRIAVPGGSVWYRINGRRHLARGAVPLLCVHGGPGASHDYLLPLTRLAERRPVILYDQLDCGLSDRPGLSENWTVERFVEEIDAIRKALHLAEVAVLGSSCGGTWVGSYAVRNPAGLRAVILASPMLATPVYMRDVEELKGRLPPAIREALVVHEREGTTDCDEYRSAGQYWNEQFVCRTLPWPACLQRMYEVYNYQLYRYMWGPSESICVGTLKEFDLRPHLPRINVPTWYVSGEHDEITPRSVREFAALTPRSRVDIIAGASHMPHIEAPEVFDAAAHDFLDSNSGDG